MLTNEIRNQIDQIWNAFWSGGISNPSLCARKGLGSDLTYGLIGAICDISMDHGAQTESGV